MKELNFINFNDKSGLDVKLTGGKGFSLINMTISKIPVPNGFVVSTKVFQRFIEENAIDSLIKSKLTGLHADDFEKIEEVSKEISSLIYSKDIDGVLKRKLYECFDKLDASLVAVRSSATSEDSKTDSWAGELETFLNTPKENLLSNVKKCWASLFSPRALTYRLEKGLIDSNISVAVVVQKMIQSEVSGIGFTVHPVSKRRNLMLIEAVYGLGEAIVSGQITPDSYQYDKEFDVVLRAFVLPQSKRLVLSKMNKGVVWDKLPINKKYRQKLVYQEIKQLADICKRVEELYKMPQDIEWAFDSKQFFITQSRPITTL